MHALLNIFGQTLRTLWAHKLRSFLTMFGIAWSVGSLLLLAGVGEGFRNRNRRQLETFGKNFIFFCGDSRAGAGPIQFGAEISVHPSLPCQCECPPLDISEQGHKTEVHMELLMAVKQGEAGIVGNEIYFGFLVSTHHHYIFHHP
jgi:ABC-type antimicrobial peptide transport system permease subunit